MSSIERPMHGATARTREAHWQRDENDDSAGEQKSDKGEVVEMK